MISKTQRRFRVRFNDLPPDIQALAREKFQLWRQDPFHPSLQFKHLLGNVWSARIGNSYRALARRHNGLVVWFWIGSHEEYNSLLKQLR